jgi:putative glutamine amidotransferase
MNLILTQRANVDGHGQPIDVLESSYTTYFNALGMNVIPVSNFSPMTMELVGAVDVDGIVLTGGDDVAPGPWWVGDIEGKQYSQQRDATCGKLLEWALENDIPLLAICYGMQYVNTHLGGKLQADIHKAEADARLPGREHEVLLLQEIHGMSGTKRVNHYHNSGMRLTQLAGDLEAFAIDKEYDVVEGYLYKGRRLMGVQWHPERRSPDSGFNETLIKGFLMGE